MPRDKQQRVPETPSGGRGGGETEIVGSSSNLFLGFKLKIHVINSAKLGSDVVKISAERM